MSKNFVFFLALQFLKSLTEFFLPIALLYGDRS